MPVPTAVRILVLTSLCSWYAAASSSSLHEADGQYEAVLTANGDAHLKKTVVRREDLHEELHHEVDTRLHHKDIQEHNASASFVYKSGATTQTTTAGPSWSQSYWNSLTNVSHASADKVQANHLALASFMMLGGSMLFYLTVFYFVSSADQDIVFTTWKTVSGSIALGVTAMIFQAWRLFTFLEGTQAPIDRDTLLAFSVLRWLGAMFLIPHLMRVFAVSPVMLEALKEIGGYFIGFSAIDAIGGLMLRGPWSTNPGFYFLGIQIYAIVFIVLMVLGWVIRRKLYADPAGVFAPRDQSWKLQVEAGEHNAFALCMGMLLSINIRYGLTSNIPDVGGTPVYQNQKEVYLLLAAGIVLAVLTFITAAAMSYLKEPEWGPVAYRVADIVTLTYEFTTAWVFFYFFQWQFWWAAHLTGVVGGSEVDEIVAEMATSLLSTAVVFVLIFVMDKIADILDRPRHSALRELHGSFSLLLGFSWEMSIFITVKGVGFQYSDYSDSCWAMLQLLLLVTLIIVPLWLRVVLPRLIKVEEEYEAFSVERDVATAHKQAEKKAEKAALKSAADSKSNDDHEEAF